MGINLRKINHGGHGEKLSCRTVWNLGYENHFFFRGLNFFLVIVFLQFCALSCQTASKTTYTMPNETSSIPLDSGAFGYIFIDVKNSRPILEYVDFNGMNDKQFQQIIDVTYFAMAAVYPPQSPRRYQLAAWGDYPSSRAKMALGASKGWKKMRSAVSGAEYWHSEQQRLSIALNAAQAFVLAVSGNSREDAAEISTDPFSAAPGVTAPEGFGAFSRDAVLSCWFDNPGPLINQKLQAMGVPFEFPAERFFISLFPVDEEQRYEAHLRIQVSSETQARGLASVFAIARNFLSLQANSDNGAAALASILFANPPVLDGKNLNINTTALDGRELALLFKLFSL
ncbi:MAG: hypothetical protein LBH20_11350 [Treponema sp.]|jgi:hypothetical protein|nr:hypothetical protein [Treponema sp.]